MIDKLETALPALLMALLGVSLAVLSLTAGWPITLLVAGGLAALACIARWRGRRHLPENPAHAVRWIEWFALLHAVVGGVVFAFLVWANVRWKISLAEVSAGATKAPTITAAEELFTTVMTVLTAFYTTVFAWGTTGIDADVVRKVFEARYGSPYNFKTEDCQRWVFSNPHHGVTGWGFRARRKRAAALEKCVKGT